MSALSTDDRVALTDLVHRYAALVDDRDPAGVAALFTPDGVLATAAPPRDLDPVAESVGRAAVHQTMSALASLEATFHAITGTVFDADGDPTKEPATAIGRVSCLAHHVTRGEDGPRDLVWAITYRDRYTRTAEGWRFARRSMHITFVATQSLKSARTNGAQP